VIKRVFSDADKQVLELPSKAALELHDAKADVIIKFIFLLTIIAIMTINNPLKRKSLTLIELLVAISLLAIILTEGLYLLTSQTKQAALCQKNISRFLKQEDILSTLEGLFFHLNTQDTDCLKVDKDIYCHFDNHIQKDPKLSGFQKAYLKLHNNDLILDFEDKNKKIVIASHVLDYGISFYSQKSNWQLSWRSSSMGLPEMIHLKIKTKDYAIDQKLLCPFKQIPVSL